MNAQHNVTAQLWDLLHPYALLGGLVTLTLFLAHGAIFLSLRTSGEMVHACTRRGTRASIAAAVLMAGVPRSGRRSIRAPAACKGFAQLSRDRRRGGCRLRAVPFLHDERDGVAFALSAGAIALLFASLFVEAVPARAALDDEPRLRPDARRGVLEPLHADA